MSLLTLELRPEMLERLEREAARRQQPVEEVVAQLLEERLSQESNAGRGEPEQVRRVLQEAGLLSGLTGTLRARIDPSVRHEDVVTALGRARGKPLSEIVLEQRGPKE